MLTSIIRAGKYQVVNKCLTHYCLYNTHTFGCFLQLNSKNECFYAYKAIQNYKSFISTVNSSGSFQYTVTYIYINIRTLTYTLILL
jgi:hypothetical protein